LSIGTTGAAVLQMVGGKVGEVVKNVVVGLGNCARSTVVESISGNTNVATSTSVAVMGDWIGRLLRREWRIACLDLVIRL
jgi:hypothetical protein